MGARCSLLLAERRRALAGAVLAVSAHRKIVRTAFAIAIRAAAAFAFAAQLLAIGIRIPPRLGAAAMITVRLITAVNHVIGAASAVAVALASDATAIAFRIFLRAGQHAAAKLRSEPSDGTAT